MAYTFQTTTSRSALMSKIKSKNTIPEVLLRKKLWNLGLRYRIHAGSLPGKPDIVFNRQKLAIFIDGEFWHGFKWENKKPKIVANRDYWVKKIEGNIRRDLFHSEKLTQMGFTVLRFWEHEIKKDINGCINIIKSHLH